MGCGLCASLETNSFAPMGLGGVCERGFPPLKRWAIIGRPVGTELRLNVELCIHSGVVWEPGSFAPVGLAGLCERGFPPLKRWAIVGRPWRDSGQKALGFNRDNS